MNLLVYTQPAILKIHCFWLPLWYFQTLLRQRKSFLYQYHDSDTCVLRSSFFSSWLKLQNCSPDIKQELIRHSGLIWHVLLFLAILSNWLNLRNIEDCISARKFHPNFTIVNYMYVSHILRISENLCKNLSQ